MIPPSFESSINDYRFFHGLKQFLRNFNCEISQDQLICLLHAVLVVRDNVQNNLVSDTNPQEIFTAAKEVYKEIPFNDNIFTEIYHLLKNVENRNLLALLQRYNRYETLLFSQEFIYNEIKNKIDNSITPIESVFIPDFFVFNPVYIQLIEEYPNIHFYTTCPDEHKSYLLKKVYNQTQLELINTSIDSQTGFINHLDTSQKIDLVMGYCSVFREMNQDHRMGLPFGRSMDDIFYIYSVRILQFYLDLIKPQGEMLLIMPERNAVNTGDTYTSYTGKTITEKSTHCKFRQYLQNNLCIKEIHACTEPMTYCCLLQRGKTFSILFKKFQKKNRRSSAYIEQETTLSSENVKKLDNWNIDFALALKDESIQQFKKSNTEKILLNNLCQEIFRGKSILSDKNETKNTKVNQKNIEEVNDKKENSQITMCVVNLKDITDYGEIGPNLETIKLDRTKNDRYILQDGDVLVAIRGTVFKAAIYHHTEQVTIPSVNFLVIRPNPHKILGDYLMLFLTSDVGYKFIESHRSHSIFNLKAADFEKMEIPVPPLSVQKSLVQKYQKGLEKYNQAVQQWKETLSKIYQDLY